MVRPLGPRRPLKTSPLLSSQRAAGLGTAFGVDVNYRLVTSENMRKLLFPQRAGQNYIVAAINDLHREMANDIVRRAELEYHQARRSRPNRRRDARRPERLMERELNRAATANGRGHPIYKDPEGFSGIRAANGFMVDFNVFDQTVISPKGFPYWRSLEFGYASFMATRPMFTTSPTGVGGTFSAPRRSSQFHTDPRMPQYVNYARYESVRISGFSGYGFIAAAVAKGAVKRKNYGREVALRLPPEWAKAIELVEGGASIGRPGGRGQRRILFQSDPRF